MEEGKVRIGTAGRKREGKKSGNRWTNVIKGLNGGIVQYFFHIRMYVFIYRSAFKPQRTCTGKETGRKGSGRREECSNGRGRGYGEDTRKTYLGHNDQILWNLVLLMWTDVSFMWCFFYWKWWRGKGRNWIKKKYSRRGKVLEQ